MITNIFKAIIFSVVIFLIPLGFAMAYDLPPGIPDPGFGLNETAPPRPSPWTSEQIGYYYIEDVAGCNDSQIYGYPGSPRCHIPTTEIPAGSRVEVASEYTHSVGGIIRIISGGTAQDPVWIIGGAGINFREQIWFVGSYLYGQGLRSHVTGTNDACYNVGKNNNASLDGDHIMIRDSYCTGAADVRTTGSKINGNSSADQSHDVILVHNTYEKFSQIFPQPDHDFDAHIITIMSYTKNVWVLDNTIHDSAGSGVGIGQETAASHATDEQNIYVARNHVYNTLQANIAVKDSTKIVFAQNNLHDSITRWQDGIYGDYVASPAKCIGYKGEPTDFWIVNNYCNSPTYGVHGGGTTDNHQYNIYIIGNIFTGVRVADRGVTTLTNPWDEAGISMVRGGYVYSYFNTLYDVPSGINAAGPGGSSATNYHYEIDGNIIQDVRYSHMASGSRDIPSQTSIKNNIFYQTDSSPLLFRYDIDYNNLADFQSSGKCSGCVKQNPLFKSTTENDFSLASSSPAIDKLDLNSLAINPYSVYQSQFGQSIKNDILGTPRPDTSVDAGAIEQSTATGPTITVSTTPVYPYTTTSADVDFTTNTSATCKWSYIPGVDFDNQTLQHDVTGTGTNHTATLIDLESNEDGTHFTAFILCKDQSNNLSRYTPKTVELEPNQITFSDWNGNQTECEYFGGTYSGGVCNGSSTNLHADVNNSGTINTFDANLTFQKALGLDMSGTDWVNDSTTGDANCNGTTNTFDANLIFKYSLGLDVSGSGWCGS